MNRSITIHPTSLTLGLVFGVFVLLSMSQMPPLNARSINIQYMPDPRDMVQIREGVPYTVPPGKLFVLTALGTGTSYNGGTGVQLTVNGQNEASAILPAFVTPQGNMPSCSDMIEMPSGMTASAGSIIAVSAGMQAPDDARAWGYLAPQ